MRSRDKLKTYLHRQHNACGNQTCQKDNIALGARTYNVT